MDPCTSGLIHVLVWDHLIKFHKPQSTMPSRLCFKFHTTADKRSPSGHNARSVPSARRAASRVGFGGTKFPRISICDSLALGNHFISTVPSTLR